MALQLDVITPERRLLSEQDFYMAGTIDEVVERASKRAKA